MAEAVAAATAARTMTSTRCTTRLRAVATDAARLDARAAREGVEQLRALGISTTKTTRSRGSR
ncbi:hypothetical protein ACIRVF_41490 [Kitasatospora sp. NPDC101157]|uniref:hypothetical protein n=1 Tax=Kitasatospora sp. NPDC101157 TaxID=3364098 RepID=UPI0037F5E274